MESVDEAQLLKELMEALSPAGSDDSGARTVNEWAGMTGHSVNWVRRALGQLKAAGRVEVVKVTRCNLAGIPSRVPAYRLKVSG